MLPTNISFGEALQHLKNGQKIARAGWNGKGMFVYLNKGSCDFDSVPNVPGGDSITHIDGIKRELFDIGDTGTVTRLPNLNMRAATGNTVTGWLASQTDLLAEDWEVVE